MNSCTRKNLSWWQKLKQKLCRKTPKTPPNPEWQLEDFVSELDEVMQNQAQNSPALRHIHAQLDPRWKQVEQQALNAILHPDELVRAQAIEKLFLEHELAVRVLVELARRERKQVDL